MSVCGLVLFHYQQEMENNEIHNFTNSEMADMHLMYGLANCSGTEARRLYQERFPNRVLPCNKTFSTIHRRLAETGSFSHQKTGNSGRQVSVRTPELEEAILDVIADHPNKSTRELGFQFNVSCETVWTILREQQLHPYHVQRVHSLLPRDYYPRIQLSQWFIRKCVNPHFLNNVLFTDEAKFSRTMIVNSHNSHIWSIDNPHAITQVNHQYQFSLNVWAGIIGDKLFVSFLPNILNGQTYLQFLTDDLPTILEDLPLNTRNRMWFMQDGAPAHFSLNVRNYLDGAYNNKWIGRGGPVPWPARSPDLNPLDFFLWGHLKSLVYSTPVDNIEELRARILNGIATIQQTPGIFERVRQSMRRRLDACIFNGGRHFEQFL